MKASCSMFSQILNLVPPLQFEKLVRGTGAERAAKGLSSWSQTMAMIFCQLVQAHSLREISDGLASFDGKLVNLGIEAPARSSLSFANRHRPIRAGTTDYCVRSGSLGGCHAARVRPQYRLPPINTF